jgi:hypothetical protein
MEVDEGEADEEARRVVLVDAKHRIRKSLGHLQSLEIDSLLQAEIIAELIDGPRSSAELVERILHAGKEDARHYEACYARVRRALKNLGANGYVATSILRRDAPHRLTRYAIARLADIGGGGHETEKLVTPVDYGLTSGSVAAGLIGLIVHLGYLELADLLTGSLFAVFFFVSGAALSRLALTLRKVM